MHNTMYNWLESGLAEQVGWLILHSVWQVCVVAAVLYLALILLRNRSAQARYALSLAAMVLLLVAPALTWFTLVDRGAPQATEVYVMAAPSDQLATPPQALHEPLGESQSARFTDANFTAALPWVSLVWAAGVVLYLLYLGGGWYRSRRLRYDAVSHPPEKTRRQWQNLAATLGIDRDVQFMLSERVRVPLTIGSWKPIVLVPVSALTGLPPQQLQAIVAHELAHIRRHDYLVNLAQGIVEALFFYHPAAWWISRQIREQREFCCDDIAKQVEGPLTYSQALAAIEQRAAPRYAMAASGGTLLPRIKRMLNDTYDEAVTGGAVVPAISALLGIATLGIAVMDGDFAVSDRESFARASLESGFSLVEGVPDLPFTLAERLIFESDTTEVDPPPPVPPEADAEEGREIELIPDAEITPPDEFWARFGAVPPIQLPDSIYINLGNVLAEVGRIGPHLDSLHHELRIVFPDSTHPSFPMGDGERFRVIIPNDTSHVPFWSQEDRAEFEREMRELREELQGKSEMIRREVEASINVDSLRMHAEQARRQAEASFNADSLRMHAEQARRQAEQAREFAREYRATHAGRHLREALTDLNNERGYLKEQIADAESEAERRRLEETKARLEIAIEALEERIDALNARNEPDLEEIP